MVYLTHTPGLPLSPFVEYLWYLSDAPPHARERILASGTFELVINLHEDEFRIYDPRRSEECRCFSGAMVSGPYRGFFVVDTREHASILGVHFRPGGACPFLGVPAGELASTHVDLEALWGRGAAELRDQLEASAAVTERFRILEGALVARLTPRWRRHDAVQAALGYLGRSGATVGDLARRVELSHRRLVEVFTAEVGMPPKLFSRARRFHGALARARCIASPDWARLSVECGYFDQSHLIRDFLAFSGFSPRDLLSHMEDPVKENHVALRSDSSNTRAVTPP